MLWLEIPAYAGSTSPAPAGQGPAPDHPRIRGEHRSTAGTTASRRGSSPHTRGALGILLAIFIQLGIIPAYAGSTTRWSSPSWSPWDHPRIRGEHVSDEVGQVGEGGSSPHTRGAPRDVPPENIDIGIIPAYAGSTWLSRGWRLRRGDHPRIRGEHGELDPDHPGEWIIPAYAGSTGTAHLRQNRQLHHPRIRGEHGSAEGVDRAVGGSSPHTRGALPSSPAAVISARIIPAYAGSTRRRAGACTRRADHPRIRGEHVDKQLARPFFDGSSPHTRGALGPGARARGQARIIPAYAGSTLIPCSRATSSSDHPRIRGEHAPGSISLVLGSWIIPAYAGSTWWSPSRQPRTRDHPRIRGEHPASTMSACRGAGSSPHTRGAPGVDDVGLQGRGIIPAYAGSTPGRRGRVRHHGDHPRIRGEHPYPTSRP